MTDVDVTDLHRRKVQQVRAELGHPVVDSDGHHLEYMPLVVDFLRDYGGKELVDLYASAPPWYDRPGVMPFRIGWGVPAENTLDRMTVHLPKLLHERLEGIGMDFALLYPTIGLVELTNPHDELRRGLARAFNRYYAAAFAECRDRLEPVAVIPTFTPEEAVAELRFAVEELGLKSVVMSGVVPRWRRPDGRAGEWVDTLGHGSLYDYDPLWAACEELRVAPTFHGVGMGWGSRTSATNYVYNHVGSFAAAQEAVCRSLVMGGVPARFPGLRFAFLEGGVTWAAQLLADLIGHYEKRNLGVLGSLDPAKVDLTLARELFGAFGSGPLGGRTEEFVDWMRQGTSTGGDLEGQDEFVEAGLTGAADIVRIFSEQFFFGCEADDPLNALAFDQRFLPEGGSVNAMFASDIGHWDVPDMGSVFLDAWERVEDRSLSRADFGRFVHGNVERMLSDVNPSFFDGTAVKPVRASTRDG